MHCCCCCCFNIFTSYNIIFSIHFDRFFPAPYSMSNRMITQTSMSPYMSPLSTYQVWILFLLINMHFKTYVCKIHEHCNRNMWFCFKIICKRCVFEIWNSFWGGFGDVGQVCDKCRYSLLCLFMCHRSRTWSLEIAFALSQTVYRVCLLMFQMQNPSWMPHQSYIMQHPVRTGVLHILFCCFSFNHNLLVTKYVFGLV